jgi:hypothetical protein
MKRWTFFSLFIMLCTGAAFTQEEKPSFFDYDVLPEVRIYFEQENWSEILDSLKDAGNDDRLEGAVLVDGQRYEGVGVRYKGNSSFNSVSEEGDEKLPFNIKIDYDDNNHRLPGGFEKIKLSNVFRDPSFLREVLSYDIAGRYMPAPRANYAKLYINDQYLGLYNNTESVEGNFLIENFGSTTGTLIKCDPAWDFQPPPGCPEGDHASLEYLGEDSLCYAGLYEMKSGRGWRDLIRLTRILNKAPDSLEQVLNINQALWMLAFNNVLVNLDSYNGMLCHNYYLYQDTFGVFHPVVWDMNLSFGGFRHAGGEEGALSNEEMQTLSPFLHYRNEKRPLIMKLLGDPLYRKVYIAHIRTILHDNFSNGRYLEKAKMLQEIIGAEVKSDSNKLYTHDAFLHNLDTTTTVDGRNIIGIVELMEGRRAYLSHHPLIVKTPPLIEEVDHKNEGDTISIYASIKGAEKAWLYHRCAGRGNFQRLEMIPKPADSTSVAEQQLWSASIPLGPDVQYYLVAEDARTASLSPERASWEFYAVDPENQRQ